MYDPCKIVNYKSLPFWTINKNLLHKFKYFVTLTVIAHSHPSVLILKQLKYQLEWLIINNSAALWTLWDSITSFPFIKDSRMYPLLRKIINETSSSLYSGTFLSRKEKKKDVHLDPLPHFCPPEVGESIEAAEITSKECPSPGLVFGVCSGLL